MQIEAVVPAAFACLASIPRKYLFSGPTSLESMPNLTSYCGGTNLLIKRDDCTGLAFGGNKVRQLEFYLGAACSESADTIVITGAVQSNFVRLAAAGARKLGMNCHVQLEERVATTDPGYHKSGNVFLDKLFGATLHSYPDGEDEAGADRQVRQIAAELRAAGSKPYIEHAQKVRVQAFQIIHNGRPGAFADDRTTSFEDVISVIAPLQRSFHKAQKRSSTGSADPSPGRCC